MISIRGLHKFYNKGRQNEIHVINDVTLDLPEKGMVAVFGKSGCGKTTLLNVIGGLDKFGSGSLTIENQSISENTDLIRNQYIGYIFQNYNLNKEESCFDNVADALRLCGMSDYSEIEARVTAALTNVGMERFSKRTPETLSGGQQQRIAIARAIVKNPRIILADEPTGNLDEANTVMIMDLLKEIARDHLVLLVTHEASLVDYYCDLVIELEDGRIVSQRKNASADGYTARDKNDIYLGELDRSEISDENVQIEYYGEKPSEPIRIKIVNSGAKVYLRVASERVQILDEYSEIKLKDGIYEKKDSAHTGKKSIDMSALPPVKGTKFGSLFSLKSSLKSGYVSNFRGKKKGRRALLACMCMFAAVLVLMSSIFGTAFGNIIDVENSYNHNVFYVRTDDAQTSQILNEAVGKEDTGIDYVRLDNHYSSESLYFNAGHFETFSLPINSTGFSTNAIFLDASLADNMKLVAGKRDNLMPEELLISTKLADVLLEKSMLSYVSQRRDLIGLVSQTTRIGGVNARIAGIVESDESAVYLSELAMAKYVLSQKLDTPNILLGSNYGISLNQGESVLLIKRRLDSVDFPNPSESIKLQGIDVRVAEIKELDSDYGHWLSTKGISKLDEKSFFSELVKSECPELSVDSAEFNAAVEDKISSCHYEYFDYYYSETPSYLNDLFFFAGDMNLWMYIEKGVELAKYNYLPEDYYKAVAYKELYGRYPTAEELQSNYDSLPFAYDALKSYVLMYESEYYREYYRGPSYNYTSVAYMLSDEDYIAASKQIGETHSSAQHEHALTRYTLIHSIDPERTSVWLKTQFPHLSSLRYGIVTPHDIFEVIISNQMESIVANLITMAVILVLMGVCMYFIMRSSLLTRIKEIGVYRAIGVSKRNLVFKFFIESAVLASLTVLVGYLVTSAFIWTCLGASSLIAEIFYYPIWLAGAVLAALYAMSLFFGTLPIISLLRKTPSEILSKYDI